MRRKFYPNLKNRKLKFISYICCYIQLDKNYTNKKNDNSNYNWNRLWNTMGIS